MAFNETIAALAREIGAPLEAVDGVCALAVGDDENDVVTIVLQDLDNGKVAIWADLGAPHPDSQDTLYRAALEANDLMELTGGATLSVIAGTGHFRLQRVESAEALELSGRPLLEGFLDTTMKWHQMVVNARAPEQSPEPLPMMGGNFISV